MSENSPEVQGVAKGKIVQKKKGIIHSLAETFFNESIENVGTYVAKNILAPSLKKLAVDMINGSANMLFYGTGAPTQSNQGTVRTNYSGMYQGNPQPVQRRNLRTFDDVIFQTREEANDVLIQLQQLIAQYGSASVRDFYSLSNIDATYTDRGWGWTNLNNVAITWTNEGYVINLPRAIPLR